MLFFFFVPFPLAILYWREYLSFHAAAGVQVVQQICSQRTWFPSIIIIQLHRPCSFHPLPHQQQFQQRLSTSNGHRGSGHLGSSGDDASLVGSPSKLGGSGYAIACAVRLRQGLRLGGDRLRSVALLLEEEDDGADLLFRCFVDELPLPLLSFFDEEEVAPVRVREDDDGSGSTSGASAQ